MRRLMRFLCRLTIAALIALLFVTPPVFLHLLPQFTLPEQGAVVGRLGNQPIRSNRFGSSRGEYGLEFECVEFVNRVYAVALGHKNMSRMGNADSYFYEPDAKGLVAYPQGGDEPPRPWDILVFDGGPSDGKPGHVAIVFEVDEVNRKVHFVQQNMIAPKYPTLRKWIPWVEYKWRDSADLKFEDGQWHLVTDPNTKYPPVAGWSRRKE